MALTLYYLFASFSNPLPWTVCDPEWCKNNSTVTTTQNTILEQEIKILYDQNDTPNQTDILISESYWK